MPGSFAVPLPVAVGASTEVAIPPVESGGLLWGVGYINFVAPHSKFEVIEVDVTGKGSAPKLVDCTNVGWAGYRLTKGTRGLIVKRLAGSNPATACIEYGVRKA